MAKQTRPSSTPTPIRFTERMLEEIDEVAEELDLSKQDVIRLAVAAGIKALRRIGRSGIVDAIAQHAEGADVITEASLPPPKRGRPKKE